MTTEEDFQSKAHITKHMTGDQYNITRERTRVNSWEEQDYLSWKEFLAKTLGVDFYETGAKIHMGLKISKDGLSREEDVEVLKGMYDEEKGRDVGWRVFKRVFGGKDKDDGSGKSEP